MVRASAFACLLAVLALQLFQTYYVHRRRPGREARVGASRRERGAAPRAPADVAALRRDVAALRAPDAAAALRRDVAALRPPDKAAAPARAAAAPRTAPSRRSRADAPADAPAPPDAPPARAGPAPPHVSILLLLRREKGYATHFLGKWHLGLGTRELLPTYRGFDTWLGYFAGAEDHWTQRRRRRATTSSTSGKYYGDELYTRRFESLVRNHPRERPFFAYFAYQCVHDPLQAPRRFLKKYAAFDGVDPGDDSAWAFFERNGAPNEPAHAARRRAQYEAMASFVDDSVGRVEAALRARGMWRDSLVVFATDNGGAVGFDADSGNNWPLRGGKYSDFEGGVRGVCFVAGGRLPDRMRGVELESHAQRLSIADWYATVADAAGITSAHHSGSGGAAARRLAERVAPHHRRVEDGRAGELVLSVPSRGAACPAPAGILVGKWALFNNQRSAVHNGPTYPNGSAPAPVLFICGDVRAGRAASSTSTRRARRDVSNERPDVLAPRRAVQCGRGDGVHDAQPWDKAHRPALVEAQKRDYARRASQT
ncbi:sulfuric ester hydrolase [Aureococcus anophagefferens]|nr:sulfuric ester hydrolase [Aureococcus anophagefferens]